MGRPPTIPRAPASKVQRAPAGARFFCRGRMDPVEPTIVPRLTTALSDPPLELERTILGAATEIEHWLRGQWQEHESPFYCSVDLRNSGFKIAPVDTNLFPGGFNNLNPEFEPLCV